MTVTPVKAVPVGEGRLDIRVKGPNVFKRYLNDPDTTARAFDEEGFFISGDAMRLIDEDAPARGLRFDGRLSEDFKLMTGTWVRAARLRLDLLGALKGLAQDIVLTGEGRNAIGALMLPAAGLEGTERDGALQLTDAAAADIRTRLAPFATGGSASRIARLLVLADPPSMADGEITAKGNLNFRRLLDRRAALVERLYAGDPAVITIGEDAP